MTKLPLAFLLTIAAPVAAQQTMPASSPASAAPATQIETVQTLGGFAPTGPALHGAIQPGQPVIFEPSAAPSVAFPPPAPLASYPICKRGQFDNCRQAGDPR